MKRQSSGVSPSSSRRENSPAEKKMHAKTIGCMSGILHLLSNSHSRRHRRFLTFGKKQTKNPSLSSATLQGENVKEEKMADVGVGRNSRSSCEVLRSPTLPAEIRRLSSTAPVMADEKRTSSPALVARLMGLEKIPATAPESVEGKRLRLLGALQRCDEDLKALKKIIESMRSEEYAPAPEAVVKLSAVVDKGRMVPVFNGEKQQPSPVSVLDEFTRSPLSPSCCSERHSFGRIQQQKQQLLKKPGEEEISNTYMNERIMTSELIQKKVNNEDHSIMWSNKAMINSVEEVCRDIAWGENRELGRIGLTLQDYICKDLIQEIVTDLGCFYTLPFETCKKRLCF
ncbi:hypothetical protein Lal_00045889 [Lupinus albus]|uniref:Uncharacterized protein n=1 Tax=Lupinus albus TaxID=3870 RepID=A0A6A5NVD1_LUPAL|nr:hypothetical protein Lalb_Chr14g0365211 [Lupinus albus]KAF1886655.1 hypothetical protein Lal_00045889 [Lupinus albus]